MPRWARPAAATVLVVAAAVVLWLWQGQQLRLLSVASASMTPLLSEGDAIVVGWVNPLDIAVGDIVSYPSPHDESVLITHRVVQVMPETGRLVTKGDANASADPAIHGSRVIGTVSYRLPWLGRVLDSLRSWYGLVLAVYVPAALLLWGEARRLAGHYSRPDYQFKGWSASRR